MREKVCQVAGRRNGVVGAAVVAGGVAGHKDKVFTRLSGIDVPGAAALEVRFFVILECV